MKPDFALLFLQFEIGIQYIGILFSRILGRRKQIAVILIGRPFGHASGIDIRILIIRTDSGFHILDTAGIGIQTHLSRRKKPLVQV